MALGGPVIVVAVVALGTARLAGWGGSTPVVSDEVALTAGDAEATGPGCHGAGAAHRWADQDDSDRYGRLLRYVHTDDGAFVNFE